MLYREAIDKILPPARAGGLCKGMLQGKFRAGSVAPRLADDEFSYLP